jgi:phosphatidate cytidylyltransferase
MIKNELIKRVLTSIVLIFITFYCIVLNIYIFALALLAISFICFLEWNNINSKYFKQKKKNNFLLVKLCGLFYLLIFVISSYFIYIYFGPNYYIFILFICTSSDIGGYIAGRTIGGKKLTKISPNKTISGSLGSFIFSLIPVLLLNSQNKFILDFNISITNILLCLFISLSCQLGDLIISYFKRLNKIKDTGKILPGHGGLLDRIDGVILAIPSFLILQLVINL